MSKPTVNMTNWELFVYEENYSLSGVADDHPHLGKEAYVYQTSGMKSFSFENDVLVFETENTEYICPLKYMSLYPYRGVADEYIEELTHRDENSDSPLDIIIAATAKLSVEEYGEKTFQGDEFLSKIKKLQEKGQAELKKMQEAEKQRLAEIVSKYHEAVYIEMSNIGGGNTLAYNLGGYTGIVKPQIHGGMFQDSVLYMKCARDEDPCALDFRYFPRGFGNSAETYSWSDNIERAVIKNDGADIISFNNTMIQPGETKVFTPEGHGEGLI